MSYDSGNRLSHCLGAVTTTSTATLPINGPANKRGRLVGMTAEVTTTVVGPLVMQFGVAGNLNKFGSVTIGALTAPNSVSSDQLTRAANGLINVIDPITAGDAPIVTLSGGTAGVVVPTIEVSWF